MTLVLSLRERAMRSLYKKARQMHAPPSLVENMVLRLLKNGSNDHTSNDGELFKEVFW